MPSVDSYRLWCTPQQSFAVPARYSMPTGHTEVRAGPRRAFVDLEALQPFAVDEDTARSLAITQAQHALEKLLQRIDRLTVLGRLPSALRRIADALRPYRSPGDAPRTPLPEPIAEVLRRLDAVARDSERQVALKPCIGAARPPETPELVEGTEAQRVLAYARPTATERAGEVIARTEEVLEPSCSGTS